MSTGQTQKIVDAVSALTRNEIGEMPSEKLDSGWQRLEQSLLAGRCPSVPIVAPSSRWWLRGFAVSAAVLTLGIVIYRLVPERPVSPLHYVLEGTTVGPKETVQAGALLPAKLVFSDESQIRIAPSAKLSVRSLDTHGSHVALINGELDVAIRHRQGSSWQFDAGPFTVKVKGTSFNIVFEADKGRLALHMATGMVEVRGPSDDRVLLLQAGESLELFANPVPPHSTIAPAPLVEPSILPPSPPDNAGAGLPPQSVPVVPRNPSTLEKRKFVSTKHAEANTETDSWAKLIAKGDFAGVVKDAEHRGIDVTLARASAAELTALADAARYTRQNDLARKALLELRFRFPGKDRARDAAFFLGRLAEMPPSSANAALAWYETYLRESVRGPYASEALGREMALSARTDRTRARKAAQIYLGRFPNGTQAELAKSLLESLNE
jgi:hypothetical protein